MQQPVTVYDSRPIQLYTHTHTHTHTPYSNEHIAIFTVAHKLLVNATCVAEIFIVHSKCFKSTVPFLVRKLDPINPNRSFYFEMFTHTHTHIYICIIYIIYTHNGRDSTCI